MLCLLNMDIWFSLLNPVRSILLSCKNARMNVYTMLAVLSSFLSVLLRWIFMMTLISGFWPPANVLTCVAWLPEALCLLDSPRDCWRALSPCLASFGAGYPWVSQWVCPVLTFCPVFGSLAAFRCPAWCLQP